MSPEVQKSFNAFVKWYRSLPNVKPLGVEQIVFSRKYDVAGTFDCLLEIDGKVVLCDLKTTNISRDAPLGVYPEMYLQLGAYAQAYIEERGPRVYLDGVEVKVEPGGIIEYKGKHPVVTPHILIDDLAIINAGKTGNLNVVYASELGLSVEDCIKAWLRVLGTFRFLQPLAKQIKERKE